MVGLMNLGAQIRREAGQFLKQDRQKLMSPEESIKRMLELKMKEANYYEQFDRILDFLENDAEYQKFRRRFLASTGIDSMSPSEE
jgi:hypothetical protein